MIKKNVVGYDTYKKTQRKLTLDLSLKIYQYLDQMTDPFPGSPVQTTMLFNTTISGRR